MRAQLAQYVNLLFAGAADAGEIRDEILQNTLDRYDDLIAQGKSEAAAYSLAIAGIGDISEILGNSQRDAPPPPPVATPVYETTVKPFPVWKRVLRAVAIGMYIICPIPLFVLSEIGMDTVGLCGTLSIVAVATMLMLFSRHPKGKSVESAPMPQRALYKSIDDLVFAVGLALYLVTSFLTHKWYITWLIFPMIGAVSGLIKAGLAYQEAKKHEE